ncbi:MAG: SIS domain-containing protein [Firmicutes bacterium]|nr:SIS domain-containing protein [Bacillota bacterium]
MSAIQTYLSNIHEILQKVEETQGSVMETAAQAMAQATLTGHNIFAFGCSHAGLLAFELYYRTGGMATINPVRAPGLYLDVDPAPFTSQIERLPEYGRLICDQKPIGLGDVVIVHSVSGRNTVTVDFALRCKEKQATVIALTSVATGKEIPSRHPSGKLLMDVADIVIDNCGCVGDGSVTIEGVPEKVGPTSTAVGAAILNAVMTRAVELITESGGTAPIFISANVPGGDVHNKTMLETYKDHIFYI